MQQDLEQIEEHVLFHIGQTPVTFGGIVAGLLVAVGAMVLAALVAAGLRRLRATRRRGAQALYIIEKIVTYGIVIFGLMAGLSTVGLNLSSLAVFAGAIGVGVGLGLQGVVKEFVSGLVLIFDRVVNIGDYIELENGQRGLVQEIGPRATRIRTNDNIDILLPNSHLIENAVVNWTLHGRTRRIHVPFGVAYGSDKELVRKVVLEAARAIPFTLPDSDEHKAQVWLVGFGDSSLNFELLVWPTLEAVKRPAAMLAAYTWAIDDALRAANVEIPFPQRDIRVRSLFGREEDAAMDALRLDRAGERSPAPSPAAPASTNDAADDLARPLPNLETAEAKTPTGDQP